MHCWAWNCNHNSIRETCRFFKLPTQTRERKKWLRRLRKTVDPQKIRYVCCCHFRDGKKKNGPEIFSNSKPKSTVPKPKVHVEPEEDTSSTSTANITTNIIICVVKGCFSNSEEDSESEFFPFPQDPDMQTKWLIACNLQKSEINLLEDRICGNHFVEEDFITELKTENGRQTLLRKISDDAVPTVSLLRGLLQTNTEEFSNVEMKLDDTNNKSSDMSDGESTQTTEADKEMLNKIDQLKLRIDRLKAVYEQEKQEYLDLKKSNVPMTFREQKEILSKVFSDAQVRALLTNRRVRWGEHDQAVGYTIRYLSNRRFYRYLTETLGYPFPGVATFQKWISPIRNKNDEETETL